MENKKGTAVRSKHSGSFLYRVLHQRRQHQCAQGQGDDAEQGGEDHASGSELLIVAELNGEVKEGERITQLDSLVIPQPAAPVAAK